LKKKKPCGKRKAKWKAAMAPLERKNNGEKNETKKRKERKGFQSIEGNRPPEQDRVQQVCWRSDKDRLKGDIIWQTKK
jgi:hypothetical protein